MAFSPSSSIEGFLPELFAPATAQVGSLSPEHTLGLSIVVPLLSLLLTAEEWEARLCSAGQMPQVGSGLSTSIKPLLSLPVQADCAPLPNMMPLVPSSTHTTCIITSLSHSFLKSSDWAGNRCSELPIDGLIHWSDCALRWDIVIEIWSFSLEFFCSILTFWVFVWRWQATGSPFPWLDFFLLASLAQWLAHTRHSGILVKCDHVIFLL